MKAYNQIIFLKKLKISKNKKFFNHRKLPVLSIKFLVK